MIVNRQTWCRFGGSGTPWVRRVAGPAIVTLPNGELLLGGARLRQTIAVTAGKVLVGSGQNAAWWTREPANVRIDLYSQSQQAGCRGGKLAVIRDDVTEATAVPFEQLVADNRPCGLSTGNL